MDNRAVLNSTRESAMKRYGRVCVSYSRSAALVVRTIELAPDT